MVHVCCLAGTTVTQSEGWGTRMRSAETLRLDPSLKEPAASTFFKLSQPGENGPLEQGESQHRRCDVAQASGMNAEHRWTGFCSQI